jgi:CTP synthase
MRYIVVTGGVISGIGKGITSSSIGLLFQSMGYVITMIKIDPYLNVDAGTMSPYEHGECFVLQDGGECDLDLGNYERFLNFNLTNNHNITTGRIYQNVIQKERNGDYLGATVQVIPHVTDEIMTQINMTSHIPINGSIPDICIIEVGGTIGDIEGLPFIEALQQMRAQSNDLYCFVHVAMAINNPETKTKPIQHSISTLRSRGIFPDLLVVRSNKILSADITQKLHRLCQISPDDIISNPNADTIYHVPGIFNDQNVCTRIGNRLQLSVKLISNPYKNILHYYESQNNLSTIHIGIVGKYINIADTKSPDTYLSLIRAIEHAAFSLNIKPHINWIDSENLILDTLKECNCFIIPGGFGSRGIPGKLNVANYARINKIPILGICLGMQIMVIDCYNNLCNGNGYSTEWIEYPSPSNILTPVIDILPNQTGIKGGTMRLGNYETILIDSKVKQLYKRDTIIERHRHRYEVNNSYVDILDFFGLKFVGYSNGANQTKLMEIIELQNHPFYIGCQYHPEFISRYESPHPLFMGLLTTCLTS